MCTMPSASCPGDTTMRCEAPKAGPVPVSLLGPLRMDYATAIASVREAADELSRFFENVYDE